MAVARHGASADDGRRATHPTSIQGHRRMAVGMEGDPHHSYCHSRASANGGKDGWGGSREQGQNQTDERQHAKRNTTTHSGNNYKSNSATKHSTHTKGSITRRLRAAGSRRKGERERERERQRERERERKRACVRLALSVHAGLSLMRKRLC